jgi:hypothetical protein
MMQKADHRFRSFGIWLQCWMHLIDAEAGELYPVCTVGPPSCACHQDHLQTGWANVKLLL